jgi:hypothetical protein
MVAGPSFHFSDVAWTDKWATGKHAKVEQSREVVESREGVVVRHLHSLLSGPFFKSQFLPET